MENKFFIYAGDRKIAEGKGLVISSNPPDMINSDPWGNADADPIQQIWDKKVELSFEVKTSSRKLRKIRRQLMVRKPRLPRKLKKAARHTDIRVFDVGQKADISTDPNNVIMQMDIDCSLRIIPAGYPRTRWVRRLIHLWRREMNQTYERFIRHQLDTLSPSPETKNMIERGDIGLS